MRLGSPHLDALLTLVVEVAVERLLAEEPTLETTTPATIESGAGVFCVSTQPAGENCYANSRTPHP